MKPPSRTASWLALLAGGYGLAWGAILLTGAVEGSPSILLTSGMYSLASTLAGFSMVWLGRSFEPDERRAWTLIGVGTLAWAMADVLWLGYTVAGREVPYPGWPDVFYLLAYPLWIAGVIAFPYARGSRYAQWRLALDGAAGTTALALIMWHLYLKNVVSFEGATLAERFVNPAYPFGDVLLLSGLVILSVRRSPHRLHRPLVLLAAGTIVNTVADIWWWTRFDSYVEGGWMDGLWVIGYGLFALAAWSATRPTKLHELPDRRVSARTLVVPYLLVAALMAITAYQILLGGGDPNTIVLQLGAGVVSLIVIGRQSIALREFGELVERERRDLVASMSHELRTPLTAMAGFSEVLTDAWSELPDTDRKEMVDTITGQTRYLSRIVTDLIEVSRDNLTRAPLDIGRHQAASLVREAIGYANLDHERIAITIPNEMVINCDRGRIIQVIVNLIVNASRYGAGRIEIVGHDDGRHSRIEVHDDGPGVPVKYQQLMWERFERANHRYDATTPGTGLGLAIVKGLAEAHGGTAEYQSSDRLGGACFAVKLPTSHPAAVSPPQPALQH